MLQFEEGKIGPASDVYTLGVTLFALSFNRMPFNSVLEILNGSLNIGLLPSKQAPTEEFKDQWYETYYTIGFPALFFIVVIIFAWKYGHDKEDEIEFMDKMKE